MRRILLVVVVLAGPHPGRMAVVQVAMHMGRMGVVGILLGVVPLFGIEMRVSVVELGMVVYSTLPRAVHLVAGLPARHVVGQLGVGVARGVRDSVVAVQLNRRIVGVVGISDPDAVGVGVARLHRVDEHQPVGAAARFVPGRARSAHV